MKKLIAWLAALTLITSVIPSAMVSAESTAVEPTNGYYVLEAETGTYSDFILLDQSKAFGGKCLYNFNNYQNPNVEWTINVPSNKSYDIWALQLNSTGLGTEMNTMGVGINNGALTGVTPGNNNPTKQWRYSCNIPYYTGEMAWNKVSTVSVSTGQNKINYGSAANGANNLTIIDRILIVPSEWGWSPDGTIAKDNYAEYFVKDVPIDSRTLFEADNTGSIILEAEKGIITDAMTISTSKAFNGKYVYNFNSISNAQPCVEWRTNIPDDRAYDVWALTLQSAGDGSEMNQMEMFYGDNGKSVNVSRLRSGIKRYNAAELGLDGFYLCWQKVYSGEVFGSGQTSIYYNMASAGSNNLFALDRVVVVPTDFCWRPNSTTDYVGTGSTAYLTDDAPHMMDAPFVSDENNVIWMEAENAEATAGFNKTDNVSASGGKELSIDTSAWPLYSSDYVLDAKFVFDVHNADSYDVWVLAPNAPANTAYSHYKTSLNDSEFMSFENGYVYGGYDISDFPELYTTVFNLKPKWVRVNAGVSLAEGRNKFVYRIGSFFGYYHVGQVDCVAVVPSRLNWIPDSVNKPDARANGFAWIEMTNSIKSIRFSKNIGETSSIKCWGDTNVRGNEKLDYRFTLANNGNYDIYFLGTKVDAYYLSKLYMDIDSNSATLVDASNTKRVHASEISSTFMRTAGEEATQEYWQKIGQNVSISSGEHILNMEWAEREGVSPETGIPYENHYLIAGDVVIVPTAWEWSMPEATTNPTDTALDFDVYEKYNQLAGKYSGGVTGNLEGLFTPGSAGSKFTYSAKTPNLIAADGTVTRPSDVGASGWLEILAHKIPSASNANGFKYNSVQGDSQTVKLWVMPLTSVDYKDFNAVYSDNTEIVKNSLESGKTVNVSIQIKKNNDTEKSAMLAVAVYKNGVLVGVTSNSIASLTNEYQSLTTSVTLPVSGNMSEYSVKAFLWDSLKNANPYAGILEY